VPLLHQIPAEWAFVFVGSVVALNLTQFKPQQRWAYLIHECAQVAALLLCLHYGVYIPYFT
jgi:hypothetical protein